MLTLIPHLLIGLDRVTTGRIHQMRVGQSYSATHPTWSEKDPDKTSPTCQKDAATFEHVILYCELKV